MNCSQFRQSISALVDHQIDASSQSRVEAHLDICESCTQFLLQCQKIKGWTSSLKEPALPEDFAWESVKKFRLAKTLPLLSSSTKSWVRPFSLAALLFFTAILFFSQPVLTPSKELAQQIEDYLHLAQNLFPTNIPFDWSHSQNELRLLRYALRETSFLERTHELLRLENSPDPEIASQLLLLKSLLKRIVLLQEHLQQSPPNWEQISAQHQAIFQKVDLIASKKKFGPRRKTPIFLPKTYPTENATEEEQVFLLSRKYFLEGSYERSIENFRHFCKKFPDSPYYGKAQYLESLALERLGKKMASFHLFAQIQDPDYTPVWKIAEYEEEFYENNSVQIWLSTNNQDFIPQISDPVLGHVFNNLKLRLLQHYKNQGATTVICIQSSDKTLNTENYGTPLLKIMQQYPLLITIEKVTTELNQQRNLQLTAYQIKVNWDEFKTTSAPKDQQFMLTLQNKAPKLFLSSPETH
ncbi:MAG: zf-HC2 domain-containing protein [Planctomycetota bacterium]